MDHIKTGKLIRYLRTRSGLTQKQLAERINVSDKAVSKWECGNGCPDISLLSELSDIFGTDIQILLSGEINRKETEKGDMKKLRFYVCKDCGNTITSTGEASVICCGNRLTALEPVKADESRMLGSEDIGGEWYISSNHEMTKEHYILFIAFVTDSSFTMFRQYPEWDININLPVHREGRLVWYCRRCGLLYRDIIPPKNRGI